MEKLDEGKKNNIFKTSDSAKQVQMCALASPEQAAKLLATLNPKSAVLVLRGLEDASAL